MCGILGLSKNPSVSTDFTNDFEKANESIRHRGPDYTGCYEDELIRMNHLLLAIRGNVSESTQPIQKAGSPWVLAFNGQIYNTTTICRDLGADAPHSNVDTILLYALILKYGWQFINHIHGMFAIALYNKNEGIIKLYRDQSGQKNLYYTHKDGRLVFASEIKALLAFSFVERKIDDTSLKIASVLGYIPAHRTIIANLQKLQPAEELTFNITTKALHTRIYVSPGEDEYRSLSPKEALTKTVEDHLQSRRDISINLSGGLDSSLIFHECIQLGHSIHAFSTRFEGGGEHANADATLAERLARDYGQRFTPITITSESYLEHFIDAYQTIEEPNYNISVPIYYETARTEGIHGEGLRVVLSGDGGDELFGGYPHYALVRRVERYKNILTPTLFMFFSRHKNDDYTNYRELSDIFLRFRGFKKLWLNEDPTIEVHRYIKKLTDVLLPLYAQKQDNVYRALLLDRFIWLAGENFIRSDKLFMSQSMEMRCPLAYTPLRTFMDEHIHKDDYINEKQNKLFLRRLYADTLPTYITRRKDKTGWRAPVALWYNDAYKQRFLDILSPLKSVENGIDWMSVIQKVEQSDVWPGKEIHLYLSLALLIEKYKLTQ